MPVLGVELPERYQPIRRIARGGMASVWCAQDQTLDRHVAIKLLSEPYAHDQLAGRRFMREARAAARLSGHGNVVTIYDVGRAASEESPLGRPFIVMEYLAGGTLADALRTGELDRETILRWLRQAAAALDYGHRRGVIHRDVKLSNFLLDRDRTLHVADFGIAQLGSEDTLTSSGQVLGTAAYLAPECALGLPASESSDRYALAVAAFELLVGERPYTAQHFAAQARQHVEEPVPRASQRNPALPPALDGVLARGMAKSQGERFASAAELVEAIDQALAGPRAVAPPVVGPRATPSPASGARAAATAVSARSASEAAEPVVYGRRRSRGRLAGLAALAAVLLGVAVAAGATLLPGSSHRRPATLGNAAYAQRPAHHRAQPATAADRTRSPKASATAAPTLPAAAPTPATAPGATALESEGHQLMVGGDYRNAIPVLRQAVAAAPRSSLTYAYALFDLGRALRLAGDPRAAVPILWERLQIPNQTDVVRSELALALEALGQSQTASGGASVANPPAAGQRPGGRGGATRHHNGAAADSTADWAGANSQGD